MEGKKEAISRQHDIISLETQRQEEQEKEQEIWRTQISFLFFSPCSLSPFSTVWWVGLGLASSHRPRPTHHYFLLHLHFQTLPGCLFLAFGSGRRKEEKWWQAVSVRLGLGPNSFLWPRPRPWPPVSYSFGNTIRNRIVCVPERRV